VSLNSSLYRRTVRGPDRGMLDTPALLGGSVYKTGARTLVSFIAWLDGASARCLDADSSVEDCPWRQIYRRTYGGRRTVATHDVSAVPRSKNPAISTPMHDSKPSNM
jgi:hypothetical protein